MVACRLLGFGGQKRERESCWIWSFPPQNTVDVRNPKQPPGMYKTLQIMGHLPYQLVQFFFHQQYQKEVYRLKICTITFAVSQTLRTAGWHQQIEPQTEAVHGSRGYGDTFRAIDIRRIPLGQWPTRWLGQFVGWGDWRCPWGSMLLPRSYPKLWIWI